MLVILKKKKIKDLINCKHLKVDKRIQGKDVEIVGKMALKCDYLLNILA